MKLDGLKILLSALLAVIFLTACSQNDERRHPLYQKAVRARSSGNGAEAAGYLEELLKRRPRSIYTHLLLANIYDEMLRDPLMALMHYRSYLEKYPDAPDAEEVTAWITQSEKRLYALYKERFESSGSASLPDTPAVEEVPVPAEDAVMTGHVQVPVAAGKPAEESAAAAGDEARRLEIEQLKTQLKRYQARHAVMVPELERLRKLVKAPAAPQVAQTAEPAPAKAGDSSNTLPAGKTAMMGDQNEKSSVRYYTVVSGDSPGRIARKVYGKSSMYNLIMQANPKLDARKLRPGMKLIIPPKPEN